MRGIEVEINFAPTKVIFCGRPAIYIFTLSKGMDASSS